MFEKKKITKYYTVDYCKECKKEHKRNFEAGDFLFKGSSDCPSCNSKMQVEKIFCETIEQ